MCLLDDARELNVNLKDLALLAGPNRSAFQDNTYSDLCRVTLVSRAGNTKLSKLEQPVDQNWIIQNRK